MSNDTTQKTPTLTVILDSVGRTILGETASAVEGEVSIKNPVVLHVVPADNQGKMSVQLLPLFFREFLGDKTGDVTVNYKLDRISTTDIDALDFRLQAQYAQMFNANNSFVVPQDANNNNPVVNLFDE
jgi:hypothetical protein